MIEDMTIRRLAPKTQASYIRADHALVVVLVVVFADDVDAREVRRARDWAVKVQANWELFSG
ncbi:MAG: hypothetical protein V3S95_00125, partial [Alphaproteobacteria bacterium]